MITPEMVIRGEVECVGCGCEPEYRSRIWRTENGVKTDLISYTCSCGSVITNGLFGGMASFR